MEKWNIEVVTSTQTFAIEWDQFEKWKDAMIPVDDYIPGKEGEAVNFMRLLQELGLQPDFSEAIFTAEDGYEQKVDMCELQSAFLLYKQKGEPLKKGFPVRLYVPGSDSDCLNVKSVRRIFLH